MSEAPTTSTPPEVSPALTPHQAQLVLRRNVQNLVDKVKAGKLLNATEQAMVEALAGGKEAAEAKAWAENKVELAELLGITRQSVDNWLADGAPPARSNGKWPVNDWRAWMSANGKKSTKAEKGEAALSKTALEARRLLLMNEKLEFEIAVLKGGYTKDEDVQKQAVEMYTELKKVLLALPDALAPQVVGVSVPEAAKRLREAIDDALLRLHTGTTGSTATP